MRTPRNLPFLAMRAASLAFAGLLLASLSIAPAPAVGADPSSGNESNQDAPARTAKTFRSFKSRANESRPSGAPSETEVRNVSGETVWSVLQKNESTSRARFVGS